jgi:hypothetical protein
MKNNQVYNILLIFMVIIFFRSFPCDAQEKEAMIIMGWVEIIRIESDGPYLKAKLDTGALTSSLHATDIEYFKKNNQKMVRFVLDVECVRSGKQAEITFEKPLKRNVRIRQHQSESMRRPVVIMDLCIGGKVYSTPFSLTSRYKFNYPVLLGRDFLKDRILVDSGNSFLMSRVCPGQ